jgi:hypothetical protein
VTRHQPLWLQQGSYPASVDRQLPGALWPEGRVDGCAVTLSAGTTVNIAPGRMAVPSGSFANGSTLCSSDAVEQLALPAPPAAGADRIDLVVCRARGNDLDGGVNNDFIFDFVTGADGAPPVKPATPPGTLLLASVYQVGGTAAIDPARISDDRRDPLALPGSYRFTAHAGVPQALPAIPMMFQSFEDSEGGASADFDLTTGTFTTRYPGYYLFILACLLWWPAAVNGEVYSELAINDLSFGRGQQLQVYGWPATSANPSIPMTVEHHLSLGDRVKIHLTVNGIVGVTTYGTPAYNNLSVSLVKADRP